MRHEHRRACCPPASDRPLVAAPALSVVSATAALLLFVSMTARRLRAGALAMA